MIDDGVQLISADELDNFAISAENTFAVKGFTLANVILSPFLYEFEFAGKLSDITEFALAPLEGEPRMITIRKGKAPGTARITLNFGPAIEETTVLKVGWGEKTA